ncbi:hypothetical protein CEXT_432111 [Caerostris extrusa]|uniref:Uncharacterized protein n=1 Tax=Caerostris extrusa TaxID=172846 RepID=A0AAV4RQH0_CAEEX|nr:hypothetical protein CEXT_432111 [Caerostris extrusa]
MYAYIPKPFSLSVVEYVIQCRALFEGAIDLFGSASYLDLGSPPPTHVSRSLVGKCLSIHRRRLSFMNWGSRLIDTSDSGRHLDWCVIRWEDDKRITFMNQGPHLDSLIPAILQTSRLVCLCVTFSEGDGHVSHGLKSRHLQVVL